jgi:hypothetical protein
MRYRRVTRNGTDMPSSSTSVFSEPDDYQAELQRVIGFVLTVAGAGDFRAVLTRIDLPRIHLMAGEENLARLAIISPPSHTMRVALPPQCDGTVSSDGIPSRGDEIVIHGPGHRVLERTIGPCRWRTILLPPQDLRRYGRAMIGSPFNVPHGTSRWRPARAALRRLSRLHNTAIRMTKVRPDVVTAAEPAHGLEQGLIDALIECLSTGSI